MLGKKPCLIYNICHHHYKPQEMATKLSSSIHMLWFHSIEHSFHPKVIMMILLNCCMYQHSQLFTYHDSSHNQMLSPSKSLISQPLQLTILLQILPNAAMAISKYHEPLSVPSQKTNTIHDTTTSPTKCQSMGIRKKYVRVMLPLHKRSSAIQQVLRNAKPIGTCKICAAPKATSKHLQNM
jgi:hypothetical protein